MSWIYKDNMTLDDMGNNVAIIYPALYKLGWKKQAIKTVVAWCEYMSTINPHYTSQDDLGNPTRGLLQWIQGAIDMWMSLHGKDPTDGDAQIEFLHHTSQDPLYWTSNPDADPVKPPITMQDFIETDDSTLEVMTVIFGWYYLGKEMDYFEREQIMIYANYWDVFIDELPKPDEPTPTGKKKSKWIYYLRKRRMI